jgi:competence protein ComEC
MKLRRERILILVLLAAAIAVWWFAWQELSGGLTITVLDVGQGDSILVQAPGGRTMLVDGGGRAGEETRGYDVGREVVTPALMTRGVGRIDVLVITHPHDDHIGGLKAVLEAVPVGMVLDPMLPIESRDYEELRESIRKHRIAVYRATAGQRINLGEGIYADVLNPPDPRLHGTRDEVNDNSVVMRLVDGGESVLLAADIDRAAAERLARLGDAIQSTILKVPHHGSADSAAPEFLEAVRPQVAVISVGAGNPFGHPSSEMLDGLRRVGAKVMRTDEEGAITIRLRPPRWSVWGYVGRPGAKRLSGEVRVAKEAA